jgi:hypothetical protein
VVIVLGVIVRNRGDGSNVGSQHPQQVDLLLTLRIRHIDDAFIPFTPTDVGETDTGVPGSTFDDGTSGLEETFVFGVLDEEEGGPVFDGSTGGHEFGLGEDVAAGLFGETVEADLCGGSREARFSGEGRGVSQTTRNRTHQRGVPSDRTRRRPYPHQLIMLAYNIDLYHDLDLDMGLTQRHRRTRGPLYRAGQRRSRSPERAVGELV